MNFFKRALLSVQRRKGKSLILFAVIFVLGNVMAGAISIQQGTKGVEETIKKQLGATATVSFDNKKMEELMSEESGADFEMKSPTPDVYKEIGALEQVNYYDYAIEDYMNSAKLKNAEAKDGSFMMGGPGQAYFNLKGVNYPEMIDIKSNRISLKDGRVFTEDDIKDGKSVVVISDKVAEANDLRVGDKMVLDQVKESYDFGFSAEEGDSGSETEEKTEEAPQKVSKDYAVEVIGIYQVEQVENKKKKENEQDQMQSQMDLYDRLNVIYMPNNFLEKMRLEMFDLEYDSFPGNFIGGEEGKTLSKEEALKQFQEYVPINATYILKKPEVIADFKVQGNDILAKNKLDYYKILVSSDKYDSVAGPVKGMSRISKLVLIVSVIASIFIITLVVILFLRDRKHELGIYLSLGETRSKVVGQIVIEVVAVALLAITLSVFSGNFLAKSFSSSLIATQTTDNPDEMMMMDPDSWALNNISSTNVSEGDVVDAYDIKLTPTYIILFYIVGLGVILVSTVAPLVYIMRLNPKKIMM